MKPCFFVQNDCGQQAKPVMAFARQRHGVILENHDLKPDFDPMNCGIDWDKYQPILPYGSVSFIDTLKKSSALAPYVLHDRRNFKGATWNAALDRRMISIHSETQISHEWRCWIIGGRLVEASQYSHDGNTSLVRGAPSNLVEFAYKVLNTWTPAPCMTMDVAMTEDGLRILRFNPIHSSDWYAANANIVLLAWLKWAKRYLS